MNSWHARKDNIIRRLKGHFKFNALNLATLLILSFLPFRVYSSNVEKLRFCIWFYRLWKTLLVLSALLKRPIQSSWLKKCQVCCTMAKMRAIAVINRAQIKIDIFIIRTERLLKIREIVSTFTVCHFLKLKWCYYLSIN